MYLEYRICFSAMNIMISNEYRTIRMVCFSPSRNSRAVALAKPGLTAGWLADRRNAGKFQIFKIHYRSNFYTFCAFNNVTALLDSPSLLCLLVPIHTYQVCGL